MSHEEKIRAAFDRKVNALTARPAVGQGTAVTRAHLIEGLTCEVVEGDWKFTVDVPETSGGNNKGPNPGVFGRGALASCLAISYAMWAAKRGIAVNGIDVEIRADYDARGHFRLGDNVTPGYREVRYVVTIESDAAEAEILKMMDEAEASTAYLDVFANPQPVRREVHIVAPRS